MKVGEADWADASRPIALTLSLSRRGEGTRLRWLKGEPKAQLLSLPEGEGTRRFMARPRLSYLSRRRDQLGLPAADRALGDRGRVQRKARGAHLSLDRFRRVGGHPGDQADRP